MKAFETIRRENMSQIHGQFFAETRLASSQSWAAFHELATRLIAAGCSAAGHDGDAFEIGDGRIMLRLVDGGAVVQVIAKDVLTFIGMRTMLEVYLREIQNGDGDVYGRCYTGA
jgi:hypothetical protein